MRCHICDRVLDEPKFNADHEDYDPCDPCLQVIQDTLASYEDKPYAEEDDLSDDVPLTRQWEGYFASLSLPDDDFT